MLIVLHVRNGPLMSVSISRHIQCSGKCRSLEVGPQVQTPPQQTSPPPRPPEASIAQIVPRPLPAQLASSEAAQPLGVATQSPRMRMARVIHKSCS